LTKEVISISEALEVALHFGHQTNRWNPKMEPYIYGKKEGVHIIDLTKTVKKFQEAYEFLKQQAKEGKTLLMVGTKKQAQQAIAEEAQRAGLYYVVERWLGGTLTNFETIRKSISRLHELEEMEEDGRLDKLIKKEAVKLKKEKAKLEKNFSGIKDMEVLPDCLFIVDSKREKIAVAEARKLNIPIVAIIDTNCDPDEIDYPIPANDDTIRSIELIASRLVDGILEGQKESVKPLKTAKKKAKEKVEEKTAEDTKESKEKEEKKEEKTVKKDTKKKKAKDKKEDKESKDE
jgi:small subunit ribosomal protein S2